MPEAWPRRIYALLLWLAQPMVWLRLLWRARRQPEYLHHLGERYALGLARHAPRPPGTLLWLHAVSVGETHAAAPLIASLLQDWPEATLLLTHMTPTGRACGSELAMRYPGRLLVRYLPYDLPGASRRFFDHYQPAIGLLMETELWPNLIACAAARQCPILLINARLSARSLRGYQRVAGLIRPALQQLTALAAQTAADAERLRQLGAPAARLQVCGNLKFDVSPDSARLEQGHELRRRLGGRFIFLAASTRDGEEALILESWRQLRADSGLAEGGLLLLVPRHPQRFDEVAALLTAGGWRSVRRSAQVLPDATTDVWLGDSMGEMPTWYALADLALIGGSLLPFGGQNLIEAAACGCPVLIGPHTHNFAQASEDAIAAGAARRLADVRQLTPVLTAFMKEAATLEPMRLASGRFCAAHQGATRRHLALVRDCLHWNRSPAA